MTAVDRRGKSVVLTFTREEESRFLIAELGMTGLLLFHPPSRFHKHTHVVLSLDGGQEFEVRYWNPRRLAVSTWWIKGIRQIRREAFWMRSFIGLVGGLSACYKRTARSTQGPAHASTEYCGNRKYLCK